MAGIRLHRATFLVAALLLHLMLLAAWLRLTSAHDTRRIGASRPAVAYLQRLHSAPAPTARRSTPPDGGAPHRRSPRPAPLEQAAMPTRPAPRAEPAAIADDDALAAGPNPAASAASAAPLDLRYRAGAGVRAGPAAEGIARTERPTSRSEKLAHDVGRSARQDCRTAHAGLGVLALPALVVDAVRPDGCRW